jgi:glycosyltransferase involved in cell wall biosynthesis
MRVLHVSDVYFPRINGVSTSIQTLLRALGAAGHQVTLVAPRYGDEPDGPEVLRVPSRRVPNDPEDRWMRSRDLVRLTPELAARRFDLVHVHTPFAAHRAGLRWARSLELPLVESYHTYFEEYLRHYVPWAPAGALRSLARLASRLQCNAAAAIVVPSEAMRQVLADYGVATPMAVIPTGLADADWRRGDGQRFRARHGIAPTRPVLVHVGRIAFEKNLDFLIDVLASVRPRVPDVLLVVAGEGPASAALWHRVCELGLERHVLCVGYLERGQELADCYRAGDVFVFASRTETQGLVLLEAMALGVPVVSTAVLGTRDILAARRGAVVAEESVGDFAAKTIGLLGDQERRAALGRDAAAHARGWTAAAMAERMVELYRRASLAPDGSPTRRRPRRVNRPRPIT